MDVFMEYLIKRKRSAKDNVIVALLIVAALMVSLVLFIALFIMSLSLAGAQEQASQFSSLFLGLGLLLIAGVWYGAYILINRRSIEYEYILTNSEMDIDKIMAKKGRKRMISFDFKEAEIVANINDDMHNSAYKNSQDIKLQDFTGNKDNGNVYFVDISVEGERTRVLFQPTSRMMESIRKFNPSRVFIKEDY